MSSVLEANKPELIAAEPSSEQRKEKLRLDYLDGIRGLSALYVVIGHIYLDVYYRLSLAERMSHFWLCSKFLCYGFVSVAVFIVLSGYCLAIPMANSPKPSLSGGLPQYFKRRSLRILPAYYAALIASILLIASMPCLKNTAGSWNLTWPGLQPDVVLTHLLLVHNFQPWTAYGINYPLWSVATEWQIYFLLPLLLLPLWRKAGLVTMTLVACVLGYVPHFFHVWDDAHPWFFGLFAVGMAAAAINLSSDEKCKRLLNSLPWRTLAGACLASCGLLCFVPKLFFDTNHCVIIDPLIGMATGCFIVYLTRVVMLGKTNMELKFLEWRPIKELGSFSYSLYLTHAPLLAVISFFVSPLFKSTIFRLLALSVVSIPATLAFAYLFSRIFERPFLAKRSR